MDIRYFDAKCIIGRRLFQQEGDFFTAEQLLADMDYFGVAEAMVIDAISRECHPEPGNKRILEIAKNNPCLHPAWALLPNGAKDEQISGKELIDELEKNKVGAVYLFPTQYRYNLADWCIDEILEPLEEKRTPVFVCYDEVIPPSLTLQSIDATDWKEVVELCRRFPKLPVIVTEKRIRRAQRTIYRALESCENLHIELSGYWLDRGIEYITKNWGSNRLIFGSNWPVFGYGMTIAPLARADISDKEKADIAGDNLRRLMKWVEPRHPKKEIKPPADKYVAMGRGGVIQKKIKFWDCHGHIGGKSNHYHIPGGDLESTVKEMDRHNIEKTCVFSFMGVVGDEVTGNDIVADVVRKYPERFVGFTLLNPTRGEREMLGELKRCAKLGLRGIKLIPFYQGYPQEGELIELACKWANDRKQIILNHHWGSKEYLNMLTEKYQNACFIEGHSSIEYSDIIRKKKNLFICTCAMIQPRSVEEMVKTVGADKLLFGSDLQDLPIAWGLGPIMFARIPEREKEMILGGNLRKILAEYSRKA